MNTTKDYSEVKKFLSKKIGEFENVTCKIITEVSVGNFDSHLIDGNDFLELFELYKKTKTKPSTFIVRNVNCDEESLECAMTEMFVPLDVIFLIEKPQNEKIFFTIENTEKNILIANELKNRLLETGQNIEIELD